MKLRPAIAWYAALVSAGLPLSGWADGGITGEQRAFFETRIRPVLVEHCYECHAAGAEKIGAKLLLDTAAGLRAGGESGSPMVAGDSGGSLLMHALRWQDDLEMPPDNPLPETVIADFARWIDMGAPDPRTGDAAAVTASGEGEATYPEGALWSFDPIEDPALPKVSNADWPRDPIDHFVLAAMNEHQLEPAGDADPRTLLRRLHFDLIGLPPTMAEVDAFIRACAKDRSAAVAAKVDELLASPHFGERWGRHWLDVARYAESNGNDGLSRNATFPHAWRYRDYVIDAFNRDTPYDRFLTEQIAGDLLEADSPEERDRLKVATGFLALGSKPAKAMNNNFDMDVVADQIDAIGSGVLGLSVACARCHDHKFDPIPTRDYYALAGLFTSTETLWGIAANVSLTAPPTQLHVLETEPKVLPPDGLAERIAEIEALSTKNDTPLKKEFTYPPGTPLAMGVRERKEPADCKINLKGDAKKLGEAVPRGFLSAYEIAELGDVQIDSKQSGRLQLAEWLTHPAHPQTARVMANRVWLHLFGQALVGTPDDFGVYGERPSHPELLDHLASRFVHDDQWSVKRMIRRIVLSRTYQLASQADPALVEADPDNRWYARHLRRRLDAESLRDAILAVSGRLDAKPADGSAIRHFDVLVNHAGNLHEPSDHRSVYLAMLRNSPPPELAAFDLPPAITVTGRRNESVLPTQSLFLLNSDFVVEQARHFSSATASATDIDTRLRDLWRRAVQREPDATELAAARYLIETLQPQESAWPAAAQALFASSEFRYYD